MNVPVFTLGGRLLGYADLFDPVAGVVGEFDGADYRGAVRQSKDADREGGFRDVDLDYFKITGLDLRDVPLGRRAWMEQVAQEGDPGIREIIGS